MLTCSEINWTTFFKPGFYVFIDHLHHGPLLCRLFFLHLGRCGFDSIISGLDWIVGWHNFNHRPWICRIQKLVGRFIRVSSFGRSCCFLRFLQNFTTWPTRSLNIIMTSIFLFYFKNILLLCWRSSASIFYYFFELREDDYLLIIVKSLFPKRLWMVPFFSASLIARLPKQFFFARKNLENWFLANFVGFVFDF